MCAGLPFGCLRCLSLLPTSNVLCDMHMTLIIHEMLSKKGKATQHNRKTKQHNTTRKEKFSCFGGNDTCSPYACILGNVTPANPQDI